MRKAQEKDEKWEDMQAAVFSFPSPRVPLQAVTQGHLKHSCLGAGVSAAQ